MKIKELQKLENLKVGSTLIVDGIKGPYTNEVTRMAKKAMGLPVNSTITKEFTKKLVEAEYTSILPESFEPINYRYKPFYATNIDKIYKWIVSKKKNTILSYSDIHEIATVCWDMRFSFLHCIAHLINESAWGTSYRIRKYNNGFGIGIYDRGDRFRLKYLRVSTSAYEWCLLLNRLYIPRGQTSEQRLNISARRHRREWFNIREMLYNWQNYATSQSKSVSCGLLVSEMRKILNEQS